MYVLFVCNRLAPSIELAHVIRALQRTTDLKAVVLLGSADQKKALPPEILGGADEYLLTEILQRYTGLNPGRGCSILAKMARGLRCDVIADILLTLRAAIQGEAAMQSITRRQSIDAVVTADDRSLGFEFGIVHAAKRRGIPTLTIPFALSDPGGDWLRRQADSRFSVDSGWPLIRWLKKRLMRIHPENVRWQNQIRLMFLTAGQTLAMEYLHARFPIPWAYGGGATDIAAVYSESIRQKQISLGVPSKKLTVTGQCSMDELFIHSKNREIGKESFYRRYSLDTARPLIILAVPHHAEHGLMNESGHRTMSERLLNDLVSSGANVLLSLHPRSNASDYADMASRTGAVIAEQRLLDILAFADLFIATHSSTVRWAILLQLPVIVLDDFGVGANGMFEADDVHFITDRSHVASTVSVILRDSDTSEIVNSGNISSKELFDGASAARIISLLRSICQNDAGVKPGIPRR